jgi:hypothetical protein
MEFHGVDSSCRSTSTWFSIFDLNKYYGALHLKNLSQYFCYKYYGATHLFNRRKKIYFLIFAEIYLNDIISNSGSEAAEPRNICSNEFMNTDIKVQSTVIFFYYCPAGAVLQTVPFAKRSHRLRRAGVRLGLV